MNVVIGLIINKSSQVLITRRSQYVDHAGYWEFPGGKVEANESQILALKREIKEEVNLDIVAPTLIHQVCYQYPNKIVNLFFYAIHSFSGDASCCEQQQDLQWVNIAQLSNYQFPEANRSFIVWLQNIKQFV